MADNPCQPIRELIAAQEQEIHAQEERLGESPASLKPVIQAIIKREKQHLAQLKLSLKACEKARKS